LCRFCRRVQGVDEEPWGWRSAAFGAGRVGVDPAEPAVLLEQGEGRVEVGGLGEAPPGCSVVGVAAGELGLPGVADPVQ